MGLLTVPEKMADAVTRPPELSDAEYVRAVLRPPTSRTEEEIDRELLEAAQRLGIDVPASISGPSTARSSTSSDEPPLSGAETAVVTPVQSHTRTVSNASNTSGITAVHQITSNPSILSDPTITIPDRALTRKRSKTRLSFSQYDKYLSQLDPNLHQPKFVPPTSTDITPTLRSVRLLKRGLSQRLKWGRGRKRSSSITSTTTTSSPSATTSCICCHEDSPTLHTLPCAHTYCPSCLTIMITQSILDESAMPPRCCTQPIPTAIIKSVLPLPHQQQLFLSAVLQFSVPWDSRIYCPLPTCGSFIPPPSHNSKIPYDPNKHNPFSVVCRSCKTSVCITCKRPAHRLGQDCPEDRELDAVIRLGEKSGWRRCYKCRALVELVDGCTHVTCRCRAQFCYICGAVWDPVVGCPNYCAGEEELERRRAEEEARRKEVEVEKRLQEEEALREERERREAEGRMRDCQEGRRMKERWEGQMAEFIRFEGRMRGVMRARHEQRRLSLGEKFRDAMEKTRDRHARTEQHLEDRQIEAELELTSQLEQSEKSVRIQLKYMEAYCNGPSRMLPEREVTRKHRERLARQYHVRDGMERRHQSQINVLREKQAKKMEELVGRHEREVEALLERRAEEVEDLGLRFTNEEEALARCFEERKERMVRRWGFEGEVLRREMEEKSTVRYGRLPLPEWPGDGERVDEGVLPSVTEEGGE